MKMTRHMNKQKTQNFPEEKAIIDPNANMTKVLGFARKDFQTII